MVVMAVLLGGAAYDGLVNRTLACGHGRRDLVLEQLVSLRPCLAPDRVADSLESLRETQDARGREERVAPCKLVELVGGEHQAVNEAAVVLGRSLGGKLEDGVHGGTPGRTGGAGRTRSGTADGYWIVLVWWGNHDDRSARSRWPIPAFTIE